VTSPPETFQFGVVPYRFGQAGAVEIMLVTSRDTGRWVIPKGWPIDGLEPHLSAAREAYEEAGLIGITSEIELGHFRYLKKRKQSDDADVLLRVFPMVVEVQLEDWPERAWRNTRWFAAEEAAQSVEEEGLADIIRRFARHMGLLPR